MLLSGFKKKPKTFKPPFKAPAGTVLPSKINNPHIYTSIEQETEIRAGSSSTSRCDGLWGGEAFKNYSVGACQNSRGGNETLQDPGHAVITRRCLPLDCSKSPPLRKRQVSVICHVDIYLLMKECVHSVFWLSRMVIKGHTKQVSTIFFLLQADPWCSKKRRYGQLMLFSLARYVM